MNTSYIAQALLIVTISFASSLSAMDDDQWPFFSEELPATIDPRYLHCYGHVLLPEEPGIPLVEQEQAAPQEPLIPQTPKERYFLRSRKPTIIPHSDDESYQKIDTDDYVVGRRRRPFINTTYNTDEPKPYPCTLCPKQYDTEFYLNRHMKSHKNAREYVCSKCGQAFNHHHHLVGHMVRHNGPKSFKCNICLKGFARPSDRNKHQLIAIHNR